MAFPKIAILNYHKIDPQGDIGITSRSPARFEADLSTLHNHGYQTVTFKDIYANRELPPKPVIITFDDGYASVYEYALPLMENFGYKGVVFMPAAYMGRYNDWDVQFGAKKFLHLSREELISLAKKGFEIAAHGMQHRALTLKQVNLIDEIETSKEFLQEIINRQIITFCYPFGRFNEAVMQKVKNAGYHFGVASIHYRRIPAEMEQYAIRRFNVYAIDSQKILLNKLNMDFNSVLACRDYLFQLGGRATVLYQTLNKPHG